jgi:plastocyanin
MNRYAIIAIAIVAGAVLVASAAITTTMAQKDEKVAPEVGMSLKYKDYKDGVFKVRAGGGGHTAPLTRFFPGVAEIKVGESVMWYNPTRVGEPHTVTFVMDNSTYADFIAPFVITGNATSAVPNANAQAVTMPGPAGKNVIIAANARSISPTVISENGTATYLPPNASYTMKGGEKYVNSGWMWPEKQSPPGLPPISTFTVKFEQAGTYNYICAVHPWMNGRVVVK